MTQAHTCICKVCGGNLGGSAIGGYGFIPYEETEQFQIDRLKAELEEWKSHKCEFGQALNDAKALLTISRIQKILIVPAAEYVPAIGDALEEIEQFFKRLR